jgi:uncharacterized LabA/DUF88 family protein
MEKVMEKNIALLIDAENISAEYIGIIVDEANKVGRLNYRRIYGDWTTDQLKPWKSKSIEFGLTPVQQYSYRAGKNASDFTLIIDAMDILYRGKVDSFCIVTSDSDFTKLVTRLKEDNMYVFGMGESKTPNSLVSSCEAFIYLDIKKQLENGKIEEVKEEVKADKNIKPKKDQKVEKIEPKDESSITPLNKIIKDLEKIIDDSDEGDDGWVHWSLIAQLFQKKYPGFHPRNYGKNVKTLAFFETRKEFEFKKEGTLVYIKIKK